MKVNKLTLYRHRFQIGYVLLVLAFLGLMFLMPLLAPKGLAAVEMDSVVKSMGDWSIVNLPYRLMQRGLILWLGISPYVLKLPSIMFGLGLGLFLVLLLNRWFKSNVALLASILIILSPLWLFLAGSGTPMVMYLFWPTILLWMGSKIQGEVKPAPCLVVGFVAVLLLSITTPYMVYLAGLIVLFALFQPHLRYVMRKLPLGAKVLIGGLLMMGVAVAIWRRGELVDLFTINARIGVSKDFGAAMQSFFSWGGGSGGIVLSPLVGLGTFAIAMAGLIANLKVIFTERKGVVVGLVGMIVVVASYDADFAVLLMLPIAIAVAQGLKYIFEKWYGLFPENPYARVMALLPIGLILATIIVSDLSHYIYAYRYSPVVAGEFDEDLVLVNKKTSEGKAMLLMRGDDRRRGFYELVAKQRGFLVVEKVGKDGEGMRIISLGATKDKNLELVEIIASPKSFNSDRMYIYRYKKE